MLNTGEKIARFGHYDMIDRDSEICRYDWPYPINAMLPSGNESLVATDVQTEALDNHLMPLLWIYFTVVHSIVDSRIRSIISLWWRAEYFKK